MSPTSDHDLDVFLPSVHSFYGDEDSVLSPPPISQNNWVNSFKHTIFTLFIEYEYVDTVQYTYSSTVG